jgi:hypothetical protein
VSTADLATALVGALLGGGGLAFVQAIFSGLGAVRSGARARERESVEDLARARDQADERATRAERDRDYWRGVTGRYRYQLHAAGIEPDPAEPVPPSERAPAG